VTLGPNQHLRFEGKAVLGNAMKHAKFQAGLLSYGAEGDGLRIMVESFFQMEPAEVVLRACDMIEADIETVEAALGKKSEKKKKPAKKAKASKEKESKEAGEEEKPKEKKSKEAEKEEKEEKKSEEKKE
jgi:hypothetical protein